MKIDKKKLFVQCVVIVLCIGLNLGGRIIAKYFELPVWLDCIGSGVAAYFTGVVGTIVVTVGSQLAVGISSLISILYMITALAVAAGMLYCVKKKYMDSLMKTVIASFWIGILCVCISTPLNLHFQGGYSGNIWGDALVDMLDWYGYSIVFSAIAGEVIVEIVDKQICLVLAYGLIRGIRRWRAAKGRKAGEQAGKTVISMLLVFVVLIAQVSSFMMQTLYAEDKKESIGTEISGKSHERTSLNEGDSSAQSYSSYMSTIYNNTSGMMSSEANVIAQTEDGYIWIGSYAGLTRYNGTEFEFIREGGIVNVTAMLCDSKGRLWIGTNDGGIARYENGQFVFFTVENGLSVNSIRSFAEDGSGRIYVATTDCICRFDENDTITHLHTGGKYIVSMTAEGDWLASIDNNGNLFVLSGETLVAEFSAAETGVFCRCLKRTDKGILVGTTEDKLYQLDIRKENVELQPTEFSVLNEVYGIEEDEQGTLWICAESGFGYIDNTGVFIEVKKDDFDASFEYIMEDYQGNIWVASSRYGVLKLAKSRFFDLFEWTGVKGIVVNGVTDYQGNYYCGTDQGLVIINKNGQQIQNSLTNLLMEERIRCIMTDRKQRLWISTYGEKGLICYDASGKIEMFNMEKKQTTSDRFRCTLELSDGTIVAGTSDGINFIKENQLVDTITAQEDNLANSQILSLIGTEEDTVYAGSDGGGIYVIEKGEVVDTYTVEDGLSSNIILRMIPYDDGYLIVTSNSLCYMKDGNIRRLRNFPYFNNYDVIIKDEMAYVLSSAGIYVADAKQMVEDGNYQYELLGTSDGLFYGLTANAWNYVDESGRLFLCSNSGVILFENMDYMEEQEIRFGIVSLDCDGAKVAEENGNYRLPNDAKYITIKVSVQNYALQDVKVRVYIENLLEKAEAVSFQKLKPIQISNLTHGKYKVHVQIMDRSGTAVLQEKVYQLEKETQLWETAGYKLYLAFVCVELIAFATWTIVSMLSVGKRKQELERIQKELEEKVALQVEQIRAKDEKEVQMFRKMILALSDTVDAKDRYTSGHSQRVANYAKMIAARMGKDEHEQEEIYYSGLLHDVGKIRVPEAVINKPSKLTDEEFGLIKIHPVTGYRILKDISEDSLIAVGAKFHHERYDGKGYPSGLSEDNIPEIARILGVADAYDAMASNRSYRNALPQAVIRDEIVKGKGTQFDPHIADIMLELIDEDKDYTMKESNDINKTILVVDDEPMNIQMIQFIMKEEPMYHVVGVEGGIEALEFLENQEVDLILLDLEMPGMNGFAAFKRIREKFDMPIVFMTADREIDTLQNAVDLGVEDYLTKPFQPAALKEVVHSVMHFNES